MIPPHPSYKAITPTVMSRRRESDQPASPLLSSPLRRMFPGMRLKVTGLNPSLRYIILLDIVPADNSRYRFQGGGWQAVGGAEARLPDRVFIHPDSPATGAHWQSRTISFHYAKLTNNTLDSQGHVSTCSTSRVEPPETRGRGGQIEKRFCAFHFSRSSCTRCIATSPGSTSSRPETC